MEPPHPWSLPSALARTKVCRASGVVRGGAANSGDRYGCATKPNDGTDAEEEGEHWEEVRESFAKEGR